MEIIWAEGINIMISDKCQSNLYLGYIYFNFLNFNSLFFQRNKKGQRGKGGLWVGRKKYERSIVMHKIIKIRRMIQVNESYFLKSIFLDTHRKLGDLFDS